MQTYLSPRSLGTKKPEKDTQAFFAVQPNRKAILFIHGFSGDAVRSWSDFHELLPFSSRCVGSDIFFYGYDGLRAELNASATIFRAFLDRLLGNTRSLLTNNLPPSAQRANDFNYDELVIVAHSLGAVVSRRALLDATRDGSDWAEKIRLVLYAPAHKGARIRDLAVEASSFPFLKFFSAAIRFRSPLIDQLKPGSTTLRNLLKETREATRNGLNRHLLAVKVVIAEHEFIVENERFGDDPSPCTIPDSTHTSVCKPNRGFLEPLTLLEECL